jgi:glutaconyl-CoA/methylmalonyl-CoA decarboxylase subunit gamma
MRYEVEVGGQLRQVVVHRRDNAFEVSVDGRSWLVDAARVDPLTLSLFLTPLSDAGSAATGPVASREVTLASDGAPGQLRVTVGSTPLTVSMNGPRRGGRSGYHVGSGQSAGGPQRLTAPMPGKVVRVLVATGDTVTARQPVVVVEAMKMENELRAGRDGTVAELHAVEGQSVEAGALIAVIAGGQP